MSNSLRILILGGTRYFGKRLVAELIEQGHDITVVTRGTSPDPFGNGVRRIVADRYDRLSLAAAIGGRDWDMVYDQLCYAPSHAVDICAILTGRTGYYVMTSSQSVYGPGLDLPEEAFNPLCVTIRHGRRADCSYADGKRLAEAVVFQTADFPVTTVRFPVVLGLDDYTERLQTIVTSVCRGLPLSICNPNALLAMISSQEAAGFLSSFTNHRMIGPLNACSQGSISMKNLVGLVEAATECDAAITVATPADPFALFSQCDSKTMNCSKAMQGAYQLMSIDEWLPPLIDQLALAQKQAAQGKLRG
jgi:nucleoside-diphosphate-sugar epimerase